MIWSKAKQQLEGFLYPGLVGRVEYRATGYRYLPDKPGQCYLAVDKKEILNMMAGKSVIRWYENEQEIKEALRGWIPVSEEEMEAEKKASGGKIPEDRIEGILRNRKAGSLAKELYAQQLSLARSDFQEVAGRYLSESMEDSLSSPEILRNILALVDRRLGKKRLQGLEMSMKLKHPAVQYFYELRKNGTSPTQA